jgi:hypothetical protein
MTKPTILQTLEAQLQQLGSRRVRVSEFPQASRWGDKYVAYTSLSGSLSFFIFLGRLGSVRVGQSPSSARPGTFLREKLLARALAQYVPPKKQAKPQPTVAQPLSIADFF